MTGGVVRSNASTMSNHMGQEGLRELLKTLKAMPLVYWLVIAVGLTLSLLYFLFDCLLRPVCR